MTTFHIGQIVKGIKAGTFVILGFRNIGGEQYAQLKEYSPALDRLGAGEIALPLAAITAI
jgi:hypothetical protein